MRAFRHAVAIACMVFASVPARAADSPASVASLGQARAAWEKGTFDAAEALYREAIEKGGLEPSEVLEGYVRLGAIRARRKKKDVAIASFRAASIIDSAFAVPSEAGPKGPAYAAQAKRDTAAIGSLQLSIVQPPKETPAGKPFRVRAHLDAPHVAIVAKVGLTVRDATSGHEAQASEKPTSETTELEVPASLTTAGAALLLRVDALDRQGNRLASVEERVNVPAAIRPHISPLLAAAAPSLWGPCAVVWVPPKPFSDTQLSQTAVKKRGFWGSPWPYVVGGALLLGAGTALYLGTRPPAQVSVGPVGVDTR